ncbi:rhodanese-related sulfurtransferase [Paenibacillus sp. LMG 31460]|uniref:Rhodanese-related sulfurtransferase n=1 Tax=Paenibacillus germinis TaxID=2654979 RepID=A0ABX1Z2D8_9BACL|nr:immunity 53 family protein [Paenibacillus germinis]NOU86176.1 rhodanese-related sulfurtransferase [Paenibacillus germinis]
MNVLKWLENWYTDNCDGDWEHGYGIKITTLDNPGWAIDIRLEGTHLEDINFETLKVDRSDLDWVYCDVSDNLFRGRGGSNNLEELIIIFQKWSSLSENN